MGSLKKSTLATVYPEDHDLEKTGFQYGLLLVEPTSKKYRNIITHSVLATNIRTVDVLLSCAVSSLMTGWEKSRSAPLALPVWPAPGLRTTMSSALVELMVGEEEVAI